jgi:hypothetical protein
MNVLGALILLLIISVVLGAPRRWALVGMMAGVLYLTQGQQVEVLGFNLYAIRFMELAGFIRVMARKEFPLSQFNRVDRSFLLLYVYTMVVFLLRSSDGFANQIGTTVDALLCYVTFRGLVGGLDDFRWFLRAFLFLLAPYAVLVLFESMTGRNPFFMALGGDVYGDWIRNGRPRCLGSFRHPSLLGTLGASFLPLYLGLACTKATRKHAFIGLGLCLIVIWAANSGGPASCAGVGLAGWLCWPARARMKRVRQAMLALLVLLAMVMKAPIWYLPARASMLTGGDGWHRSYLMDVAFRNIGKWFFAGMSLRDTNGWFTYDLAATGGADITNQFLLFGLTAGVGATLLFIFLLYRAFSNLGQAMEVVRAHPGMPGEPQYLLWALGVMQVAHIFNWLGIAYFDQTYVIWFMQLAVISSLSESYLHFPLIEETDETHDPAETGQDGPIAIGDQAFVSLASGPAR